MPHRAMATEHTRHHAAWQSALSFKRRSNSGKPPGEIVHYSIIKPQNGIPFRKNAVAVIALMVERQLLTLQVVATWWPARFTANSEGLQQLNNLSNDSYPTNGVRVF
ncbi:hypothetical protein BDQ17DRAFT_1325968 [Cyathus striatus]|nr:hypothetical protein BDQ17DRAFT_1325968 [Cyathus striatus]